MNLGELPFGAGVPAETFLNIINKLSSQFDDLLESIFANAIT